jgi:hypothetical protein
MKRKHIAIPFVILTATHAGRDRSNNSIYAFSCKVVRGLSCAWLVSYEKEAYCHSVCNSDRYPRWQGSFKQFYI